jgi:hypothetical protein
VTPIFCPSLTLHERTSFGILPSFHFPKSNPTSTETRSRIYRTIHIPSNFIPHQEIHVITTSQWNQAPNHFLYLDIARVIKKEEK